MRAPWMGGLEYRARMMILSWDSMAVARSWSGVTTFSAPTRSPVCCVVCRGVLCKCVCVCQC